MVQTINFNQLRNSEHIQFTKSVAQVCLDHDPEALNVKKQYDELVKVIEEMESVFLTQRGSELTKKIIEADELRDKLIVGFTQIAQGNTNHFDEQKAEAAEKLLAHIKKYGDTIAHLNYVAETATLHDLLDGIDEKPELSEAVNSLNMNDWLPELRASNDNFNQLYALRAEKEAEKSKLSLKELRTKAVEAYRELIKYLEAASIMQPADVYTTVLNKINEFISKYGNLRRSKKTAEEVEE